MTPLMTEPPLARELEDLEIDLLLEGIRRRYGYDLGDYDRSYIRERVRVRLREEGVGTPSQLLDRVLRRPASLSALVDPGDPSGNSLFRPARVWRTLRERALPLLRTYPSVRAWVAGSAPDGDLLSTLMLFEEGLSRPYTIYATQLGGGSEREARFGTLGPGAFRGLPRRFRASGGRRDPRDFFRTDASQTRLLPELQQRVSFASHNVATDASFNEFQLILIRGSVSHFGPRLRDRSFRLLDKSLIRLGFLVLGPGESPDQGPCGGAYRPVLRSAGLFQKMSDGPE
ncbi:MAG TPA: CheR family methyltransferase [Planctomycetota bacterium]|nr:CheR family methyltransferase [Planctomycetota bacterium]